jgi:hypothetical protein
VGNGGAIGRGRFFGGMEGPEGKGIVLSRRLRGGVGVRRGSIESHLTIKGVDLEIFFSWEEVDTRA